MKWFLLPLLVLVPLQTAAAQPPVAKFSGGMGPAKPSSPEGFDALSRLEILAYARTVAAHQDLTNTASLQSYLGRPKVNAASVAAWMGLTQARLLGNFAKASAHCAPADPACLPAPAGWPALAADTAALDALPSAYAEWTAALASFSEAYFREQLRLAALFPAITDEALRLDPGEKDGWELPDKAFLLTFDDGPTAPRGNTDRTLAMLAEQRLPGIFFVLGEALQQRLALESAAGLRGLYQGQAVSAHGWTHTSHAKRPDWQDSITRTRALIHATFPALPERLIFFRPPYGERRPEAQAFLAGQGGSAVMLWNLDSQDWNAAINADEVAARQLALMLLWRRGILLFHDVHPKAATAVPAIVKALKGSGVSFLGAAELFPEGPK